MSLFQSTELMASGKPAFLWGTLTFGHWFCTHSLKNFSSCNVAEWLAFLGQGWVWEDSPFANLSRTFREPFADFSPKKKKSETNVYARVVFLIYANQGAIANLRIWDNTKLKPVRIHRQIKSNITQYLSKCCKDAIYSPKQGSCGNSARKLPSMNTILTTNICIYTFVYK